MVLRALGGSLAVPMLDALVPSLRAQSNSSNAIVLENQKPGTTAWQIGLPPYQLSNDTDQWIRGYASAASINQGDSITFNITVNPYNWKTGPVPFFIDVYRIGWYGGAGGRLMTHLGPFTGLQQPGGTAVNGVTTPGPSYDPTTGMIYCQWTGDGRGNGSYTLNTSQPTLSGTADWTSGIYLAMLTTSQMQYDPQTDPDHQSYIIFTIREDSRNSDIVFQQAVATYQAYNNYPDDDITGKSLYDGGSYGAPTTLGTQRAVKVSFDRPYTYSDHTGAGEFLKWELYFVRWLERNGYDVTYTTDVDVHAAGSRLINHKAVVIAGHAEYWSAEMRAAVESARDHGTSLGIFAANTMFNQIRFEPSPVTGVANRVIACYKDVSLDPVNMPSSPNYKPALTTVPWRVDPVNQPEQQTLGTMYSDYFTTPAMAFVVMNSVNPLYSGTGFMDGTAVPGILGYEMDSQFPNYPYPAAIPGTYLNLSASPYNGENGPNISHSSIYQAAKGPGAWVFNAGSIYWSLALDNYTPPAVVKTGSVPAPSAGIQQLTANFLSVAVTGAVGPAAPTALTAATVSTVSINLAWTNNAPDATALLVERSTDNANFAQIAILGAVTAGYADTGLAVNTLYYYRVRAQSALGTSLYSGAASAATSQVAPAAPSSLGATSNSATAVNLTWTNNAPDATAILVERSPDNVAFVQIGSLSGTAAVFTDTGLTVSTSYYYRVRARNAHGTSGYSNVASASTTNGAPAAPTSLAAITSSTSTIDLTWLNNATDASAMAVERSTDNVTFVQVTFVAGDAVSYTSGGLDQNTTYYFRVRAHNWLGESAYSNVAAAITFGPPAPPLALMAKASDAGVVTLAWTNAGSGATAILIELSVDNITFTQIASAAPSPSAYTVTGLAPGTTYYYRVRAQNDQGVSPYSNVADAETRGTPAPPSAPRNVCAGQSSIAPSTQVNVYWDGNSNNETAFLVFRSLDKLTFTQVASVPANTTEYDDPGLTPGTQYFYYVVATNAAGNSAPSNTDSTITAMAPA
jgi:phosphodiesterase/alkaline phosphatase D-like protein